jgi:hypothetical protein
MRQQSLLTHTSKGSDDFVEVLFEAVRNLVEGLEHYICALGEKNFF